MSLQASDGQGEDDDGVECVAAVGASMLPQAYNDFFHSADRATWVRERMTEVDYDLVGVPEGGPALNSVRDVLAGMEDSWRMHAIHNVQRDNVLAMLRLLQTRMRCVVEPLMGMMMTLLKR